MGDKQQQIATPEVQAPAAAPPSPAQELGANSDAASALSPDATATETPTLDLFANLGGEDAAGSAPAAPAPPGAPAAPAKPEKKLDTPFQRDMNGEMVTCRWTMDGGSPTLQIQDGGKWERPNETQLRALGYEAEVAADDTSFLDMNGGDLARGLKEKRKDEYKNQQAFGNENAQHELPPDPNAPPRAPGAPEPPPQYRTAADRAQLDQERAAGLANGTAPDQSDAAKAGKDKLMADKNKLGTMVRKLDKTGLSKSFEMERTFGTFPLFGVPTTPFLGAQFNSKLGILSMPHEDFDIKPDGLGVKATLPAEFGGEAKVIGEAGLRFGSPYVGLDGYIKLEGGIAAKAAAELEVGLTASDAFTAEGKMNASAEGGLTAALAARLVVSFGGFREEIDLGELLTVDVAKLTWTPAEMVFDLWPTPSLDYSATPGEMGFDLKLGEIDMGMFGALKDWVNEDDQAHEKIEALREAGLLDMLDDSAKLKLLEQMDDGYTNEDHEASMASIVLTKGRGVPFIDFLEKAYVNEEGEVPADDERYETLQDWVSDGFMDDNEDSEAEVSSELANSYWVLDEPEFKGDRFWKDDTVPDGHVAHWMEKTDFDVAKAFTWTDEGGAEDEESGW